MGSNKLYFKYSVAMAIMMSTVVLLINWSISDSNLLTGYNIIFTGSEGTSQTERWLVEQRMRTKQMHEACKRYEGQLPLVDYDELTESHKKYLKGIVVSERYKAVFSPIAKVACSSWKSLLLQMSGHFDNRSVPRNIHDFGLLRKHGWAQLHKHNISQITHILKTYTKFIVVRHPYSRLHSAFTNKFQMFPHGKPNPIYPRVYGTRVVKQYWENPSPLALKTGLNISFEDFIRFLGDPNFSASYKFDYHWKPFYLASHPCVVKYDYILKQETMTEDSERLLADVLNTTYRLPHKNVYGHTKLIAYENISASIMHNLWQTYHMDFELFDYGWPH